MEAKTKEEYENLINHSPLFGTDPKASPTLYMTERTRLLEYITEYYKAYICPCRPLDSYSMPLMEASAECIKSYDLSKGPFLNLLAKVFSRNAGVAAAKDAIADYRGGIKISERDSRLIRQINRYVSSRCLDINDPVVQGKLARALEISVRKLQRLIQMDANARTVPNTVQDEEGNELDIFETIADLTASAEDMAVLADALVELVDKINTLFKQLRQAEQRSIISKLLTADILRGLSLDTDTAREYIGDTDFCSMEEIEYCISDGKVHTQKEIGELYGRSESSISTTYNGFKAKLAGNIR